MNIALHTDSVRFPNLALMRLSAYHKSLGDIVSWYLPLYALGYDRVYSSKVFTFSPIDHYLYGHVVRGGTGYGLFDVLPSEIESLVPDYSLYPNFEHSLGFITRGCVRNCDFCIVPKKEGTIRFVSDCMSIIGKRKSVVFLDNNFLAYEGHIEQLEKLILSGVQVDFNQGLDARLVTPLNAALLARVRWIRYPRFACDSSSMLPFVSSAVKMLRSFGWDREVFCYCLVKDVSESYKRVKALVECGVDVPFCQPYIDFSGDCLVTSLQRRFCRWVNHKALFRSVDFWDMESQVQRKVG